MPKKKKVYFNNQTGVINFIVSELPEIAKSVHIDLFTNRIMIKGKLPWSSLVDREWNHRDNLELLTLCQTAGINTKLDIVFHAIEKLSGNNDYHPIREYLHKLEWDEIPRLDTWLQTYLGAEGNETYLRLIGSKFLISAVARIYRPGCKVDTILILEGEQGKGKSEALRIIAKKRDYFTDSIYRLDNKDVFELIRGKWIVEIPELDAFKYARATMLKQFASSAVDIYRPPYERFQVRQPRQCVFIGTTNETEYLKDETGGRRFWPVSCNNEFNLKQLKLDVDQLWAEAVIRYINNEKWWLDGYAENRLAAINQIERLERDPWQDKIENYLTSKIAEGERIISIEQILTDENDLGFGMSVNVISKADRNRVKACIESLQIYQYTRLRVNGKRVHGFILKKS